MADNIILSAGTGDGGTVATDEVSGAHYQRVKLHYGGDGVATAVSGSVPFPVTGTVDAPLYASIIGGTLTAISGTITVVGSVNTNVQSGTAQVAGSVSIIGGTVGVNVTGGRLTGTSPIDGSVSIIGGTVGVNVTGGRLTGTSPVDGSVSVIGGSVHVQGTVAIVGTVMTTATVTMGTVPAITSTVAVLASPSDAQKEWGAGSLDLIQVGIMIPTGTVAVNAGLPISGTLAAITGTVTVVGSVTTSVTLTPGTTPVFGTVTQPVYVTGSVQVTTGSLNVSNQGGSVAISGGTLAAITGTVTVVGSVTTNASVTMGTVPALLTGSVDATVKGSLQISTGGSINVSNQGGSVGISGGSVAVQGTVAVTAGSLNVSNQGGSVQVSSGSVNVSNQGGSVQVSAIVGTLPEFARNRLFRMPEGVTGSVIGTVSLTDIQATGDYLSHLTIIVGSTAANDVVLIDGTTTSFRGTVGFSVPGPGKGTYTVAINAYSRFGPWKLTTGGGVLVIATGRFTF